MRPLGTFGQFYETVTMEMMTVTRILTPVYAIYFLNSITLQGLITINRAGKKLSMITHICRIKGCGGAPSTNNFRKI